MERPVSLQALGLLLALGLGLLLGMMYELLRPLRRHAGPAAAAVIDLVFCLCALCACFFFALAAPEGVLGLWELSASLLGFLAWLHLLGPMVSQILEIPSGAIFRIIRSCKKTADNRPVFAKKFFPNVKE